MKKGLLITFEGGEGCGKSTQLEIFKNYLKGQNIPFVFAREPGGTPIGEKIRELLLSEKHQISSETELLLFSASRRALIEEFVVPNLKQGKVVVLDRFYDSTYAYQGYAGKLNLNDIKNVTELATGGLVPDLTFLLDIDAKAGMDRKTKEPKLAKLDRIEQKSIEYHNKVREGYHKMAKKEPERFVVVDASKSRDEIADIIQQKFNEKIVEK